MFHGWLPNACILGLQHCAVFWNGMRPYVSRRENKKAREALAL
jgi:hypothetical protein